MKLINTAIFILLFITNLNAQKDSIDMKQLVQKRNGVFWLNDCLYNGYCYENYPSGAKGMEGNIKEGLRDGLWIWYYENGNKKRETNYYLGKMDGFTRIYYKNKKIRTEIIYKNNKNIKQKRWNENGDETLPPVEKK